jgi:short-subunit dehydrogenase
MWLNAADVVREALRASARGKSVSIPSLRYKVIVGLARILPAFVVVRAGERGR